jgi:hypothetical protein
VSCIEVDVSLVGRTVILSSVQAEPNGQEQPCLPGGLPVPVPVKEVEVLSTEVDVDVVEEVSVLTTVVVCVVRLVEDVETVKVSVIIIVVINVGFMTPNKLALELQRCKRTHSQLLHRRNLGYSIHLRNWYPRKLYWEHYRG